MSFNIKYLPLALFLSLPFTLVITNSFAYYYKHVTYFIPYISDSGAYPPESCIFGQVLNIVAILMGLAMYLKYRYNRELFTRHDYSLKCYRLNKLALYMGIISAFGISIVANFQETEMLTVHMIGAFFAFGFGTIYQCLQTKLYFCLCPIIGGKLKNYFRFCLSTISLVTFLITFGAGIAAISKFQGEDITKWKPEDGAFELHLISTTSEWICALGCLAYLLLLKDDFENISIYEPEVYVMDNTIIPLPKNRENSI